MWSLRLPDKEKPLVGSTSPYRLLELIIVVFLISIIITIGRTDLIFPSNCVGIVFIFIVIVSQQIVITTYYSYHHLS